MLFNHDIVAQNNRILAVGGGGNCFSFGTHFDAAMLSIELPEEEFDEEVEVPPSSMIIPGGLKTCSLPPLFRLPWCLSFQRPVPAKWTHKLLMRWSRTRGARPCSQVRGAEQRRVR